MKNRSSDKILEDILEAISSVGDRGLTAVMRHARCDFRSGKRSIVHLLGIGFVEVTASKRYETGGKILICYKLTNEGYKYLPYLKLHNSLISSNFYEHL